MATKPKPEPPVKQPLTEEDRLVIEALIADIWAFRREAEAKQAAELAAAKQAA